MPVDGEEKHIAYIGDTSCKYLITVYNAGARCVRKNTQWIIGGRRDLEEMENG